MFRALIVAPNRQPGLEHWLMESDDYSAYAFARSIDQAMERVASDPLTFDIFFLDSVFEKEDLAGFIDHIGAMESDSNQSFVLLIQEEEQRGKNVAEAMMLGFHACLADQFSTSALNQVSELGRKLSGTSGEYRIKAATGIMIAEELFEKADPNELAKNKAFGSIVDLAKHTVKQIMNEDEESPRAAVSKQILDKAVNRVQKRRDRDRSLYSGASARLKKKLNSQDGKAGNEKNAST